MSDSISQATAATTSAQDDIERALGLLQRSFTGRQFNGYGVYRDPLSARIDLRDAHAALGRAIATLNAVPSWPTDHEYDAADDARSRGASILAGRAGGAHKRSTQ